MKTTNAIGAMAVTWATVANAAVLYDGSLGTTPLSQGWLYNLPAVPTLSGSISTASGQTTLDTTGLNGQKNGWSSYNSALSTPSLVNTAFPSLDCGSGFSILLTMQVLAESHATADRSGVSLIALDASHRGIELAFWTDRVWAQAADPLFTHAEEALVDTTQVHHYELQVAGNAYHLLADDVQVLTGSVRDYSAWTPSAGQPDVYELPNFLFLGDNTGSAAGKFSFTQLSTVPEPTAVLLLPIAGLLAAGRRRVSS